MTKARYVILLAEEMTSGEKKAALGIAAGGVGGALALVHHHANKGFKVGHTFKAPSAVMDNLDSAANTVKSHLRNFDRSTSFGDKVDHLAKAYRAITGS